MKAPGIVRRIDDLGRVVIPKEMRRTMRMMSGHWRGDVRIEQEHHSLLKHRHGRRT